jgi:hypothetical protein
MYNHLQGKQHLASAEHMILPPFLERIQQDMADLFPPAGLADSSYIVVEPAFLG